jgi:class 3 adenylate cyclase/tetratricopeptide (TPR) repeat protein
VGSDNCAVECSSCGHENRAGARFCESCGAPLARMCSSCGSELSATARFCDGCGHAVGDAGSPAAQTTRAMTAGPADTSPVTPETIEGERKQVTVMFVDIVGSMDLAERLDPERWRGLLDRFFALASDSVHSVGGRIDKFTGDGVMALFGAPISHEDHARRACLAALGLHTSLGPLVGELSGEGVTLAIRVGLNSGEVIVGEIGDQGQMDYTAIGHTVGLAQRMESLAPAGSTTLSAATAGLVAGEFELGELGEFEVKGSSVPQRVFELLGKASSRDRVEAAGAAGGLSRFVGRERERSALEAALQRAVAGDGQVVGLVGEPGVGKSRLAHEFAEHCAAEGISAQRARAVAHGREIPLLPVLELMRATLGIDASDDPEVARTRIAASLDVLDASFHGDLPLLFDFLGVPDFERPADKVDPEARQRQLLALVRRMTHARSRIEPAVILIEDLHWLDDSSGVFLEELVRASAGTRTLLVFTYRPDYSAEILRGSHCEQLALRPLPRSAVGELLGSLLGGDRSLDGLSELVGARAGGNPFFCEEIVQALAESEHLIGERGGYRLTRTLQEIVLPATVQATLAARIDRLGGREKELLQVASVIGYEISEPVLAAIASPPDGELSDTLRSLVSAELLSERMSEAGVEYEFKHPLTQEVAYRSQLTDRRRRLHSEVALAIERLEPEKLDERAALLAHHWEAAGEPLAAARWHARAAAWIGHNDIPQSVSHWRKVAELTAGLGESPETRGLALGACIWELNYGWLLGLTEQEARALYERGRQLAQKSPDRTPLFMLGAAYTGVCVQAGYLEEQAELADELDRLSIEIGDPGLRMIALTGLTYTRFLGGRPDESLSFAEEGITLAAEDHALGGLAAIVCPYAFCLMLKGQTLCFAGRLEESARTLEIAQMVAREQGDLEAQATIETCCVWLARHTGQTGQVLTHADRVHEIAERHGSALVRVWSLTSVGFARLILGETEAAIAALEGSIELARESRTGLEMESMRLAVLSEAKLTAGDRQGALRSAQEAVATATEQGSVVFLPLTYRVLAEALLAGEDANEALAAQEALERATAAVEATGARAELPFIEHVREKLIPV